MMKFDMLTKSVLLIVILLLAVAAATIEKRYTEDFTSRQYCDTINTTAWWDTVAGELKLYEFELVSEGSYNTPGNARNVALSGDYAFVADLGSGLTVIDISDPTDPQLADIYYTSDNAYDVAISGDYAYVANNTSGLQVIDVSDPTNLLPAGECDTPGYSMNIAISGDYLYLVPVAERPITEYSYLPILDI